MIEPSVLTSYLECLYFNFTSNPTTLTEKDALDFVRQSLECFKEKTVFETSSNDDSTFSIS